MVESQREAFAPHVYERLIDRLGLALDVARTAVRLRDEVPVELELRGLSRAEYELINAYLSSDASHRSLGASFAAVAPAVAEPAASAKVVWLEHVRARKRARAPAVRSKG